MNADATATITITMTKEEAQKLYDDLTNMDTDGYHTAHRLWELLNDKNDELGIS